MRRLAVGIASCLLLLGAGLADAAEVSGTVALVRKGKPSKLGDLRDAVVWFEPAAAAAKPKPAAAQEHIMTTVRKEFLPHVLAIGVGDSVRFPNDDPILHNVFSVSGDNSFDLGFYKKGPGSAYTFKSAGLVRVFCNVHQTMVAYVMVLGTPHFARPDEAGRFRLANVPAGPGTLHVWHERAETWSGPIDPSSAKPVVVQLDVTRPRVPQHTNKHGRSYGPAGSYE